MIERVNRQFQTLAAERKRFDKIIQTFPINPSLFSSYIATIQSVMWVATNITQSFTEVLSYAQIKMISKSVSQVVSQLVQKLQQFNRTISKLKSQKESQSKKIKTQYCSLCQQNIHENNIKQAKVYLYHEAKQNFHLAVQQAERMANQPLFTPEENKDYDEKLYLHLAQKQKVLNTNCRRMEQFVDIINSTLDDLSNLKQIKIKEDGQNHQYMSNFASSNKLGDDVSKFLKQSFSQKVPSWIHKMFIRIMSWYLQQKRQKMKDKDIQTVPYQSAQSKELRQTIKQLQKIQKQKNQSIQQIRILKALNKKHEQTIAQNMNTITALNRLLKSKQNINMRQTSRIKGNKSGQDSTFKDMTVGIEDNNQNINSIQDEVYKITRKRKQFTVLPNIKKSKTKGGTSKSLSKDIENLEGQNKNSSDSISNEQNGILKIGTSKNIGKSFKKNQIKEQRPSQLYHDDLNTKDNQYQDKNVKCSSRGQLQQEDEKAKEGILTNKKLTHRSKAKAKNDEISKQTRSSIEIKKKYPNKQLSKRNKQQNKLVKASLSKMSQISEIGPYATKSGDQSARHLHEFVSNMKVEENLINKRKINNKQFTEERTDKRQRLKINTEINLNHKNNKNFAQSESKQNKNKLNLENKINFNKQNEVYCNQSIYSNEIAVLKKVSQDLKQQILHKKTFLSKKLTEVDLQNINFQKNKCHQNQSLSEVQNTPKYEQDLSRDKKTNIQKQTELIRSKSKLIQTKNRNSSYHKAQQSKYNEQVIRNSQNTYLPQRSRQNINYSCLKSPQQFQPSLYSSIGLAENQEAQRKIFDGLKANKALNQQLSYQVFSSIFSKIFQNQKKQHSDFDRSSVYRSKRSKQYICSKFPSIYEDKPQPGQPHQKLIYRRLFLTRAAAFKYEQTMTKSYHKKKIKHLNQEEKDYCYEMFCNLCEAKKLEKTLYQQFCSLLRYPYQTLYNSFDVLSFVSDMSYETFQYFFRKIAWIHRKCPCEPNLCVCQHIQSMKIELQMAARQGVIS